MSYSESDERHDDDFYRWYVGGSPPETDGWPRHAFEHALHDAAAWVPDADGAPADKGNKHTSPHCTLQRA